ILLRWYRAGIRYLVDRNVPHVKPRPGTSVWRRPGYRYRVLKRSHPDSESGTEFVVAGCDGCDRTRRLPGLAAPTTRRFRQCLGPSRDLSEEFDPKGDTPR